MLAQSLINALMAAWIYVLVALGLTLVLSIVGIVQLAHGEIYMLGAYFTYYLLVKFGFNFFVSIVASALIVGLLGILLYRFLFRPFTQQMNRAMIIALGLILLLQNIAKVSFGGQTKSIPSPFTGILVIFGGHLSVERLIAILVSVIFVSALLLFIQKAKAGQAMVAISEDRDVAALQGIKVDRISSLAMFLGCFMAAIAGSLMGAIFSLSPTMGGFALMKGIAVIILGGLGSIPGAIIGGLIIGLVDGLVPPLLNESMASMFGFIVIILILLFRPQGIMGHE